MKAAARLLLILVTLVYVGAVGWLYVRQDVFLYQPSGTLAAPDPTALPGLSVETIAMPDGATLTAWFRPPDRGRPTLLYFHGNSGNLGGRQSRFAEVIASGFGLLAPSYRGFRGSTGNPSEAALVADGQTLHDWLRARVDGPIVLHGESLGSGVATAVAAERPVAAVVLEAPFTATLDLARERFPWVPSGLLMRDTFLTRERLPRVAAPVLIVHGTQDPATPVAHAERLFALGGDRRELALIEGGGHADLWRRGLWPRVLRFLADHGIPSGPVPSAASRPRP